MAPRDPTRPAAAARLPAVVLLVFALFAAAALGERLGPHGLLRGDDAGDDLAQRPVWPAQYEVSWQIDIPYIKQLQKDGLTYQYTAWQDTENGRQKTTRDGVESVIEFIGNNTMYQVYPRVDKMACRTLEIDGGKGPTRRLLADGGPELTLVLPDLRQARWQPNASAAIEDGPHKGANARAFSWQVSKDEGYGEVTATYTFFLGTDDTPLRLFMWGRNLYTGGHFDAYIVDYHGYKPGPVNASAWEVPPACPAQPEPAAGNEGAATKQGHWLAALRAALPSTHYGDRLYDAFTHHWGRRHGSRREYLDRRDAFHSNRAMVDAHNANATSGAGHRLGLNRFSDWPRAEWLALLLPNRGRPRPPLRAERHAASVAHHMLPAAVDWRGTGADSPVKDQAMCGSCWAFGAVGSLEAAWFRGTGRQLLLSEQQLLDCAWSANDDNKACMGGFQQLAYQWLLPRGGMASEADYPYKGVTDFCRSDALPAAKFSNARYVEVQGGERALMEALLTKGPMTVSVDAAPESFTFYASGVYKNAECQTAIDKLDHAVIASGYGTTEDGEDYWIVKNTWGTAWGEGGYLRIARQPDDCGIATQPIYVEFDVSQ